MPASNFTEKMSGKSVKPNACQMVVMKKNQANNFTWQLFERKGCGWLGNLIFIFNISIYGIPKL